MRELWVMAERSVAAPAQDIYRYLSDYREHHQHLLPPAFSDVRVEQGGVGNGTVITFKVTLGGRTRAYRQQVTEPDPGRVLREAGIDSCEVTTFTVTPTGATSLVRIDTRFPGAGGIVGVLERLAAPRLLRRLFADELESLDRYAREQVASQSVEQGRSENPVRQP